MKRFKRGVIINGSVVLLYALSLFGCRALAQEVVRIPIDSIVQLSWIAPPDTDVVAYDAIFVRASSIDTTWLKISTWNSINDSSQFVHYQIKLPLGAGHARLRAIDRARLMSSFNVIPVFYEVFSQELPPVPPSMIRIKVQQP